MLRIAARPAAAVRVELHGEQNDLVGNSDAIVLARAAVAGFEAFYDGRIAAGPVGGAAARVVMLATRVRARSVGWCAFDAVL